MAERIVRVVDLYHGDRVSSFAKAATAGVWGIIHKATTGATGQDAKYAARRPRALAAGLLWGAYHWGTNANVQKQIDNFLLAADPDEHTLVALDFEDTLGNQMTLAQARDFLVGVADRLGRRPVLYSGHLIKDGLGSTVDAFFGAHRLWLAQYGETPVVQASWTAYWLWQYTDSTTGPAPTRSWEFQATRRGTSTATCTIARKATSRLNGCHDVAPGEAIDTRSSRNPGGNAARAGEGTLHPGSSPPVARRHTARRCHAVPAVPRAGMVAGRTEAIKTKTYQRAVSRGRAFDRAARRCVRPSDPLSVTFFPSAITFFPLRIIFFPSAMGKKRPAVGFKSSLIGENRRSLFSHPRSEKIDR
jgi:hypothetical protein